MLLKSPGNDVYKNRVGEMMDATINWQFTNEDARIKLHRIYPSVEEVVD